MQIQKPYKVIFSAKQLDLDALPVAKITSYPLEKRDYKPFAQCILCAADGQLFLRMWAFEVSPMPGSTLRCVLYPFIDDPSLALHLTLQHHAGDQVGVGVHLWRENTELPMDKTTQSKLFHALQVRPHNGEDLQGVYWGMLMTLPIPVIEALGGTTRFAPQATFPGNFYKTCTHPAFAHMGSYFRAQFPHRPYALDSMGNLEVIAYS